jgi:hypothetical protein
MLLAKKKAVVRGQNEDFLSVKTITLTFSVVLIIETRPTLKL